jgi:hypothetical protein
VPAAVVARPFRREGHLQAVARLLPAVPGVAATGEGGDGVGGRVRPDRPTNFLRALLAQRLEGLMVLIVRGGF